MNKSIIKSLLILPFLFSCSTGEIENMNYTEKLKTDLKTLAQGPWSNEYDNLKYEISYSHTLTSDELGHVYTVDIGYKDTYIDDIHVIVLPSHFINDPLNHNVPHVGYNQRINLAENKDLDRNDRENIRLQIELADSVENVYVSVTYENSIDLLVF